MNNALFIKRLGALIIDVLLLSLIANLISGIFIDEKDTKKLSNEEIQLLNDYSNNVIDSETLLENANSINYESSKLLIPYTSIYLFLSILYFVIYQKQSEQTLGKKLLRIKIESEDDDLTMNQMVIRGLIINGILFNIIELSLLLFLPKALYLNAYSSIELVKYSLYIVIAFMVMFRKDRRGLHDIICHTKVVNVK